MNKEVNCDVRLLNNIDRNMFSVFNQKISVANLTALENSIDKFLEYGNIVGIIINKELVAMLNLYCNNYDTKEAYICNVYVLNEYRRNGFAKKMLNYAYSICENNEFEKIMLHVAEDNVKAINLYLSEKFCFTGNKKIIGEETTLEMCKLLQLR